MVVFKLVATVHINSLITPNVNKKYIIQGEGWLNKNDVTWGQAKSTGVPPNQNVT